MEVKQVIKNNLDLLEKCIKRIDIPMPLTDEERGEQIWIMYEMIRIPYTQFKEISWEMIQWK